MSQAQRTGGEGTARGRIKPGWACCLAFLLGCLAAFAIEHNRTRSAQATAAGVASEPPAGLRLRYDWPLVRGDAVGSGVVPGMLPRDLKLLWKFEVKDGSFTNGAVIAAGIIYVGDANGVFYAVDLASGKEKWHYNTDSFLSASAAVRDAMVFLPDGDGRLHAIATTTGKAEWVYKTESAAEINSSPNFYKDYVLFGSQDSTLFCLEAKTGRFVWKHNIDDQIRCSPTVVGSRTFLAGCDSKLHVIDVESGKELAAVDIQDQTGSTPAALGDRVFFGTEGGSFFAVNWRTAEVAWVVRNEAASQPFRASAAVTPEAVFVGGRDKRFYAVNRKTGKEMWKYEAGGKFSASPAAADGRLVIGSEEGVLYCFGEKS